VEQTKEAANAPSRWNELRLDIALWHPRPRSHL
jgi:hypothetical protein